MLVKPSKLWSNLITLGQTRFKLVLFGTGHYTICSLGKIQKVAEEVPNAWNRPKDPDGHSVSCSE